MGEFSREFRAAVSTAREDTDESQTLPNFGNPSAAWKNHSSEFANLHCPWPVQQLDMHASTEGMYLFWVSASAPQVHLTEGHLSLLHLKTVSHARQSLINPRSDLVGTRATGVPQGAERVQKRAPPDSRTRVNRHSSWSTPGVLLCVWTSRPFRISSPMFICRGECSPQLGRGTAPTSTS